MRQYSSILIFFVFLLLYPNSVTFAQWESIGSGINVGSRDAFSISVVDQQTVWAVFANPAFTPSYEYARTTDSGQTWQAGSISDTIGSYYPLHIQALDQNTAWILMVNIPNQDRAKFFKTTDGGTNWVEQTGPFNEAGFAFASFYFFNENEGVGFGSPGTGNPAVDSIRIVRTTDGGDNWVSVSAENLPEPVANEGVWIYSGNSAYETKGDTIWFVTRASRVFKSVDKGASWNAFDVGISGGNNSPGLSSIAFHNALEGIATTFLPIQAATTTDGGETWTTVTADIPQAIAMAAITHIPGTEKTYMVNDGYYNGSELVITTDGGNTWEYVTHPPSVDCFQFLSPTVGFAGANVNAAANTGIYKWTGDLSQLNSTTSLEKIDSAFVLSPNPVSDVLNVTLAPSIFSRQNLAVRLLTQQGQLLFYETYPANTEDLKLPLSNLPKGIYLLQIDDGKKMGTMQFVKM